MRSRVVVAGLIAGCLQTPPSADDQDSGSADAAPIECVCPGDPCPFDYVRPIRVVPGPAVDEELSHPPVLVRFETGEHMAADGSDLRFAATDGSLLPHEIELFPPAGSNAVVWVGVPLIPAGGEANLCMFYGADVPGAAPDPTGVWDSSFAAVWHLAETTTGLPGELADSTSRGCNGEGGGGTDETLPARVEAQVANGQAFAGDDLINFGIGSHLDLTGDGITLETWVLLPALGADYMSLISKEGYFSGYRLMIGSLGEVLFQLTESERRAASGPGVASAGSWHHLAATYDGGAIRIFVDGAMVREKAETGLLDSNEVPLHLGASNGEYFLSGSLDEVRISTVARSAGWIAFQRAMASAEVVTIGEEQAR